MKDSQSIAIIVAVFAVAGFRLYKKYVQKDKGQSDQYGKKSSSFPSSQKEDDYEPYSKK
jgi:hypothetical protein